MLVLAVISGSAEGRLFRKHQGAKEELRLRWLRAAPLAAALTLMASVLLELKYSAKYSATCRLGVALIMAGVLFALAAGSRDCGQPLDQEGAAT
jgi:hypothetical protein